ncbi:MAG: hypothetical protein ACYDEB_03855 [Dehalococcoidia bacterium]
MTIVARTGPNQPIRLVWLFARSVAVSGVIAGALYAALYVAQDMRRPRVPPAPATAQGFQLPAGLEVLTPIEDAHQFEQVLGFAPVLPRALPEGTAARPRLDATQPDAAGARRGEIRFTALSAAGGGAAGPTILLVEAKATPGAAAGSALRTVAPRTLAASLGCGGVTVDARLFFPASATEASANAAAQRFVDALAAQCASR